MDHSEKVGAVIRQFRALVDYCEGETRRPTSREKLDLLAFSILTELDGDGGLDGVDLLMDGERISGALHEFWYERETPNA